MPPAGINKKTYPRLIVCNRYQIAFTDAHGRYFGKTLVETEKEVENTKKWMNERFGDKVICTVKDL